MQTTLYLNVPVNNTVKARDFYEHIGFEVKKDFSNPMSETIAVSQGTLLMLVTKESFETAAKRQIADAATTAELVLAIEVANREAVDAIVGKAVEYGAPEIDKAFEHEGMYTRIIRDLDGHQLNVFAFVA